MKSILITAFTLVLLSGCTQNREALFNGKNLDGWIVFVKDSTVSPEHYFYVNDGVIETVGVPVGYLRTIKTYGNYRLHVEWRYPEKPTNSGIFIHTVGADMIWPLHFQCQLKYQNSGDFIVNGIGLSATLGDSTYVGTEENKPLIPKLEDGVEKPAGEWNSYDIECFGNRIGVSVNGVLQNIATNCSLTEGSIGLQAEGSKIQFRNIWIERIE